MTADPGTFESATAGRPDFDTPLPRPWYVRHRLRAGRQVDEHLYLQRDLEPSRADVPLVTVDPAVARWLIACSVLAEYAEQPSGPAWHEARLEYHDATAALDDALPPRRVR